MITQTNVNAIIIGGDLNTDLLRSTSKFTHALLQFASNESLFLCNKHPNTSNSYSFESKATGARSMVDHFLVSDNLTNTITNYEVIDEGDNLSDHRLLSMNMELPTNLRYITQNTKFTSSPCWLMASSEQIELYKLALDNALNTICIPYNAIKCQNYSCGQEEHKQTINKFHDDIVNACITASNKYIPLNKPTSHVKPGWLEYVQPHQEKALFWHYIWKENRKPREGHTANIRRQTRAKYHLAIKHIQQNEDKIRSEKMANALLDNDSRNFWKETKKSKKQG